MGFLLAEARTSGLVTAGVFPAAALAYLQLLSDRVNVIELVKAKRPIGNTVSILFGFMYQALQNNQAILSKHFFSIFKGSPGNVNDEILILEQVFQC